VGSVDSEGRKVSMLSFVDAELSEDEELPSSAVVKGIAGGRPGELCGFWILGRARRRSDIVAEGVCHCLISLDVNVWFSKCVVDHDETSLVKAHKVRVTRQDL